MTDLQRIEISGFKGIEHLEFEPSGVNLVTGRNNTGKTSLLEAIALAFDPTYVEEFGEDIDSLIHADSEECEIVVETGEGTMEIEIRHPTEDEAKQHVASVISLRAYTVFSAMIGGESVEGESSNFDDEIDEFTSRLGNQIIGVVKNAWNHLSDEERKKLENESLIFTINSNNYPYILIDAARPLMEKSAEQLVGVLNNVTPENGIETEIFEDIILQRGPFGPSASSESTYWGFFDEPPSDDCQTFLKSKNLLSAPDFEPDSGDAIKRDDLGDYLKETGLADELKTFNLDELVFQKEDGEKYSVPYDFMGDGFKTIVGLLWELLGDEIEDQIVLLEEPENHMHPGYVRKVVYFLVELAKDEDVQLFITTHNKDFIDTFFTENLRDEEVEFLEEEFTLLLMESDSAVVEDYETARESLEDLHLDLRGI